MKAVPKANRKNRRQRPKRGKAGRYGKFVPDQSPEVLYIIQPEEVDRVKAQIAESDLVIKTEETEMTARGLVHILGIKKENHSDDDLPE